MITRVNHGGRAFPCDEVIERDANGCMYGTEVSSGGMTLRDYFAAKALIAYFADGAGFALQHEASKWAYETADAMLEARK